MLEFIENYNDLFENVISFNDCISNSEILKSRLNNFRHWYYIVDLDMFAPSKFIGYKGNNSEEYEIGTSLETRYMDGRNTEHVLRKLLNGLQAEGQEIHHNELKEFLIRFNESPNKKVQIHVIKKG